MEHAQNDQEADPDSHTNDKDGEVERDGNGADTKKDISGDSPTDVPRFPRSFLLGALSAAVGYFVSTVGTRKLVSLFGSAPLKAHLASKTPEELLLLYSYAPSTLHAIMQVLGTADVIFDSAPHLAKPVAYFDSRLWVPYGPTRLGPTYYMGVFVGYLLTDHAYLGSIGSALMAGHHLAASAAWSFGVAIRSMQWYASFLQFNEFSTIFMNLRQVRVRVRLRVRRSMNCRWCV